MSSMLMAQASFHSFPFLLVYSTTLTLTPSNSILLFFYFILKAASKVPAVKTLICAVFFLFEGLSLHY